MNSEELVLEFYDRVTEMADPFAVIREIERAVVALLDCRWATVFLGSGQVVPSGALVLHSPDQRILAYIVTGPTDLSVRVPGFQVFLKMASRVLRSQDPEWSEALQAARRVIEEGLPDEALRVHGWEAVGELLPAFHVGGDSYAYLVNEDALCFLLLDAVGHGLSSALMAASCRSLWRGVVYEKDLSLAIRRLNRRLFDETGSERFVAATLGYCHPDGSVDYVCCGQSPMFLLEHGQVRTLPECEPPLGLFEDWDFTVQNCRLKSGQALLSVTDGFLEWAGHDGAAFGEEGVLQALEAPFGDASTAVNALVQGVFRFSDGARQIDDLGCLCVWRL